MLRANWQFCQMEAPIWASILRNKYRCGADSFPTVDSKRAGSNFWRGICFTWDFFFVRMWFGGWGMVLQ